MTFKELSTKEVICISDGARLGFICDMELSVYDGCITAFLLPDTGLFSFSNKPRYRVCREWVEKVGEDLILVCRYEQLSGGHGPKPKK